MIKLNIPNRCYSFIASAACLFIFSANVSAQEIEMTPVSIPQLNYTLAIQKAFTTNIGSLSHQIDYSSNSGSITWKAPYFLKMDNYVGPQVYQGDFTSVVDTSSKITYGGRKYYKIRADVGISVPIYVSISQYIYKYGVNTGQYYDLPYAVDDNSGTTLRNSGGTSCSVIWSNTDGSADCGSVYAYYYQKSSVSGRSGKIYFYMPKIPTNDVSFTNLEVANTKIHTAVSSSNWNAAAQYSRDHVAGEGTVGFRFLLSGSFTMDQSCKIDGGVALEIPLGSIGTPTFTIKGGKPSGYTPKGTTLTFSCKRDIGTTYGGMKWSISPTAASAGSGLDGVLVATPKGESKIDGVGVKITSDAAGNTPVPLGGDKLQSTKVSGSKATATFYAYPTMTTDTRPTGAGDYSATATVTFEVP